MKSMNLRAEALSSYTHALPLRQTPSEAPSLAYARAQTGEDELTDKGKND